MPPTTQAAPTTSAKSGADRIEKRFEVTASRSRTWRAISTAEEFGEWFGMTIAGRFAEGATVRGTITNKGKQYPVEFRIEKVQPESYLSFRWHPSATDESHDYSSEPMTLVEFRLDEAKPGKTGSVVTILETGFDRIPANRRDEALRMNSSGWDAQAIQLVRYLAQLS